MLQLMVLYPHPADVQQFEKDYADHTALFHEKMGIPSHEKPYTITKFLPTPHGAPAFYHIFSMPFDSPEALQAALSSAGMQEVAADANRISTGGPITLLIGNAG
ncbi:MAG: EthD family reductase [Ferruginibacter sp.]